MKVRFYGRLADAMGPELEVDAPQGCSISDLRRRIVADCPEAEPALSGGRTRACVGDRIVGDHYVPSPAEQVEFLPPVSGG